MSMGFGYLRVMEAISLFGDDFDNLLCFLVESEPLENPQKVEK